MLSCSSNQSFKGSKKCYLIIIFTNYISIFIIYLSIIFQRLQIQYLIFEMETPLDSRFNEIIQAWRIMEVNIRDSLLPFTNDFQ